LSWSSVLGFKYTRLEIKDYECNINITVASQMSPLSLKGIEEIKYNIPKNIRRVRQII